MTTALDNADGLLPVYSSKEGGKIEPVFVAAEEEMDSVRADLKRKKQASRATAAGRDAHLRGLSHLTGAEKTALAINMSIVSVPGAYYEKNNNSWGDNFSVRRPQPSQDQLMGIVDLSNNQIDRKILLNQQEEIMLAQCEPDSGDPIDDLQARMHSYSDYINEPRDDEELERCIEERDRKKKKRKVLMIMTAVSLAVCITVVGIVLGTDKGQNNKTSISDDCNDIVATPPSNHPGLLDVFTSVCAVSDASTRTPTDLYIELQSIIVTAFPSMRTAIDEPQSHERLALCLISAENAVDLTGVADQRIIQRFLLTNIFFRLKQGKAINGDVSLIGWNWLTDVHECEWDHIDCTDTKEVRSLQMDQLGLVGTIPSELALITSLVSIDMSLNLQTGTIPSELWKMTQLEQLRLSSNRLRGSMFEGADSLQSLAILDISFNFLNSTFPELLDLPNLEYFDGRGNSFDGPFPDLSRSTKLVRIRFSNALFTGSIPDYIWTMTSLTDLLITTSGVSGSIPTEIGWLTNLEKLDLSYDRLTGNIPSEIGLLSKLSILDLNGNRLSGTVPTEMCALPAASSSLSFVVTGGKLLFCDCCG